MGWGIGNRESGIGPGGTIHATAVGMGDTTNSRPAGDRDQAGDIHEDLEAMGGTGDEREVLPPGASQETGEAAPGDLTKAEASKPIDELRQDAGRDIDH